MLKKFFSILLTFMLGVGSSIGTMQPIKKHAEAYYSDDTFTETSTGNAVSFTETISYDSYTHTDIVIDTRVPNYMAAYGSNSCAPTAGAITIAYYNMTYTNLIPDCQIGFYYNDVFYYRAQPTAVNVLMETLYNYMGTNTEAPGTSVAQFKTGMTRYVTEQGYGISYTKLAEPLNYTTAGNYFTAETPIILFLNSYEYYPVGGFSFGDTQASMIGYTKTVGHVVVASGFMEYKFYNDGVLFRTDYYLMVSFGDDTEGFLKINSTSCIEEAYTISIST